MSEFDEEEGQVSYGPRLYEKLVVGHLLLIWAVKYIEPGKAGSQFKADADAISVDVVDLSDIDPETGEPPVSMGVWWRGGGVIATLKGRVGREAPMLAYMGTEPSGKGNPKYVLIQAHQDPWAKEQGSAWMTKHPDFRKQVTHEADFVPTAPKPAPTAHPTGQAQPTRPVVEAPSNESTMERLRRQAAAAKAQAEQLQQRSQDQGEIPF